MSIQDAHTGPESGDIRWIDATDAMALRRLAFQRIVGSARRAIDRRGRFLIVLAGGSTPRGVYHLLRAAPIAWSCWHVYFGDERCLPSDNVGRNSWMAADAW